MAIENGISKDFLRFSAYSIKDLITKKLSEDSKFTDQVYEGSNLAILIDLVSYMYQCLVYQLNNAASESMFADTMLYENISRLCKFIGYNPKGCSPSNFSLAINTPSDCRSMMIKPFTTIDSGIVDSRGKKIWFSTTKSYKFTSDHRHTITLVNGKWKLYSTVLVASGIDYETFILDGIASDSNNAQFVANDYIQIYIKKINGTIEKDWFNDTNEIFTNYSNGSNLEKLNSSIYNKNEKVYSVSLNSDKQYQLKFGNGITGRKLDKGDYIYVFYLDTNGLDGSIDLGEFNLNNKFKHDNSMFNITPELYVDMFEDQVEKDSENQVRYITDNDDQNPIEYTLELVSMTTTPASLEQTTEEIRENAPNWFKTGNRLVTTTDYEFFVKNSSDIKLCNIDVVDVKCMNNMDYLCKFYKWLYINGMANGNGHRYFSEDVFTRLSYKYIDPADANNIYLWIKSADDNYQIDDVYEVINEKINPIKTMTTEIQILNPVNVYFDICAADHDIVRENYDESTDLDFDPTHNSYIEVTLDSNVLYISSSIQKQIYNIIVSAFNVNNCRLGQTVNYNKILEQIYAINGVLRIRTIYHPDESNVYRSLDGLSFASWSDTNILQDLEDLEIGNVLRQLEDFQFPTFYGADTLMDKIKIIKKSMAVINTPKM